MREGPMRVLSNAGTDVVPGVLGVIDSLDPSTMVQHTVAVPFSGWSNGASGPCPVISTVVLVLTNQTPYSRQQGECSWYHLGGNIF